jgi:hypothetical protein
MSNNHTRLIVLLAFWAFDLWARCQYNRHRETYLSPPDSACPNCWSQSLGDFFKETFEERLRDDPEFAHYRRPSRL